MKRSPIRRANPERRAKAFARNYGDEARVLAIKAMPCVWPAVNTFSEPCEGEVVNAHVDGRKMGGCGGDKTAIVPLCALHHDVLDGRRNSVPAVDRKHVRARLRIIATAISVALDGPEATPC